MYFISAVTTLHSCVGGSVNDTTLATCSGMPYSYGTALEVAEVSLAWASPANAVQARAAVSNKGRMFMKGLPSDGSRVRRDAPEPAALGNSQNG
jgi:hypothetical protein